MKVGILGGTGLVGGSLGRLWAEGGHEVLLSFSRERGRLEAAAEEIGAGARAAEPEELADSDALLLAAPAPAFPENAASLYLGQPVRSVRWCADGVHEGPTVRGDVTVKVSGRPAGWRFDKEVDQLVMRFAPAFLRRVAEENGLNPDAVELRVSLDRRDDAVKHVGLAMLAEMESGGASGRVYGDSLATALATYLLRSHGTSPQAIAQHGRGLPRSALRRVTDFVNDNLSGDLGLSEMAGVANLSPYHFSRQFKRSTGLSPHQYVIRRRVKRAKELLSGTDLSVGDVASAVGFTHQSHLARHVRRHFGVAPSSLRR